MKLKFEFAPTEMTICCVRENIEARDVIVPVVELTAVPPPVTVRVPLAGAIPGAGELQNGVVAVGVRLFAVLTQLVRVTELVPMVPFIVLPLLSAMGGLRDV